eukprot:365303-Chlamydomonas_euryale.AAC.66
MTTGPAIVPAHNIEVQGTLCMVANYCAQHTVVTMHTARHGRGATPPSLHLPVYTSQSTPPSLHLPVYTVPLSRNRQRGAADPRQARRQHAPAADWQRRVQGQGCGQVGGHGADGGRAAQAHGEPAGAAPTHAKAAPTHVKAAGRGGRPLQKYGAHHCGTRRPPRVCARLLTALSLALQAGHVQCVQEMLEHEHERQAQTADMFGRTTLSMAACNGHDDIVQKLLAY